MTSNVKLLPLPKKVKADRHLPTGVCTYAYDADTLRTYAHSNMEPLIAEIVALRAEVRTLVRQNGERQARVERLAEALGLAMDWNWLDEDARPSRTAEICDAALDPTAAQEAGDG